MANRLSQLCKILIEESFGELAAQIFSVLADSGRQPLSYLAFITRLPLQRLKPGLSILLQHHMLHHSSKIDRDDDENDEDDEEDEKETYYKVNWSTAYCLVRSHKIVKIVADREGGAASKVVANVLQLGQVSVGDLLAEYDLTTATKRDSGIDVSHDNATPNGVSHTEPSKDAPSTFSSVSEFHTLMRSLLQKGYLVKVGPRTFLSQSDLHEQIKNKTIKEKYPDGRITGPKASKAFRDDFNILKRKYDDEDAYKSFRDDASRGTIKSSTPSSKRVKLNGEMPNGTHRNCDGEAAFEDRSAPRLPDDMVVRINFEKGGRILRSQKLEQEARRHFGPVTAAVYGAVLRLLEDAAKVKREEQNADDDDDEDDHEDELPSIADTKVLDLLDPHLDLHATTKRHDPNPSEPQPNGTGKHRHKRKVISDDADEAALGLKREVDSDDEHPDDVLDPTISSLKARNRRLALVQHHLQILAEHPKRFVLRHPSKPESRLDITPLIPTIIDSEIDAMICARFGKIALRIVRLLREKGKLDEHQVFSMAMLPSKTTQALLTELQFAGVLDTSELPKDGTRQPTKSAFLWFLNSSELQSALLQQTYQAMTRLLQRLRVERAGRFRAVIEKSERDDVVGREEKTMSAGERELLAQWRDLEEKMLVQIARCDDLVAVLRDFGEDVEGALVG